MRDNEHMNLEEENRLLEKFGNLLSQESLQRYQSRFNHLYEILQRELHISEGMKAGSIGMGYKIRDAGDLDIIFTIFKIKKTPPDVREWLEETLSSKLGKQAVVSLRDKNVSSSVKVDYPDEVGIDVVYLEPNDFEVSKEQINYAKNLPNIINNTIRLVKYCCEHYKEVKLNKRKIHNSSTIAVGKTLSSKVKNTINKCGGGSNTGKIYKWLIEEAKQYKK